jgi:hypothetical protein
MSFYGFWNEYFEGLKFSFQRRIVTDQGLPAKFFEVETELVSAGPWNFLLLLRFQNILLSIVEHFLQLGFGELEFFNSFFELLGRG